MHTATTITTLYILCILELTVKTTTLTLTKRENNAIFKIFSKKKF